MSISVDIANFRNKIWHFYRKEKRSFPWRETRDPYHIFVSEIMLQQTQVHRVESKYRAFLDAFPTWYSLARADLGMVYTLWQGLGYNRRAKFLREAAKYVVDHYAGKLPSHTEELLKIPGIGPATAAALQAFVFNIPTVYLETNVRTVFLHEFFPQQEKVADSILLPYIKKAADVKRSREWNYALLDYGSYLKKLYPNPSRRSKHYSKQSKFLGSDRQIRGKILKVLVTGPKTINRIVVLSEFNKERVEEQLVKLVKEGFVVKNASRYSIAK